jgi:hypothetical protein
MVEPAYKDPSTHVNIMTNKFKQGDAPGTPIEKEKKRTAKDLSHHTFFIENSQMRLKLVARTEVCLFFMKLWHNFFSYKLFSDKQTNGSPLSNE